VEAQQLPGLYATGHCASSLTREEQDYIVGWVQGLAAHIDKYDQAQQVAPNQATR
jgi:hypothetical protein